MNVRVYTSFGGTGAVCCLRYIVFVTLGVRKAAGRLRLFNPPQAIGTDEGGRSVSFYRRYRKEKGTNCYFKIQR